MLLGLIDGLRPAHARQLRASEVRAAVAGEHGGFHCEGPRGEGLVGEAAGLAAERA